MMNKRHIPIVRENVWDENINIYKIINEGFFSSDFPGIIDVYQKNVEFDEFFSELLNNDKETISWFLNDIRIPTTHNKINMEVFYSPKTKTMYLYSLISPPINVWNHIASNFDLKPSEVNNYVFVDENIVKKV